MPRQVPRRAQADPSTPVTAAPQQHQQHRQPPPVRNAAAGAPIFETPPGFRFSPDTVYPRQGAGAVPGWQVQAQQQQQQHPHPPVPWQLAAAAGDVTGIADGTGGGNQLVPEFGETMENDDGERDFDREADFGEAIHDVDGEDEELDEIEGEEAEGEEDEDEEMHDRGRSPSPPPPELREISSLASWTVSTHKPGCGVAALRNPSPEQFWQSDGPQPHTLTLHFFKRVAIVKMRVYLDFELDESYTPTKMVFLAGMGGNDLVEFAAWEGESPCGWVDIPLEGVGGRHARKSTRDEPILRRRHRRRRSSRQRSTQMVDDESDDSLVDDALDPDDPSDGNVLKAMVIQVRICENHQNGKDTHVRGFQVFAYDEDRRRVAAAAAAAAAASSSSEQGPNVQGMRKSIRKNSRGELATVDGVGGQVRGLDEPDWMGEPTIR